jgi:hypothetical protein
VVSKPTGDDNLIAYWDLGACGPHGDDYQWDWCDSAAFQCKDQVATTHCSSGYAKLVTTYGDGTCCSSLNIDGCDYAYFAQYQCSDFVGSEIDDANAAGDYGFSGSSGTVLPKSQWDISGGVDFILEAKFKTTAAGGTIVGKAFANGLWKNGGSAGQAKMVFLRDGKVGMDIGWVGYFACNKIVNDGNWHSVALKYVQAEGEQYQLFVDDMQTPCSKGLKPIPDNPDTSIVEGTAIGHVVNNGVANGDMAPAMDGEVTGVTYKQHPYSSR